MSVMVNYASKLTTIETLEVGVAASVGATVKLDGYDTTLTNVLSSTTASPVTKDAYFEQALTNGAATVDLITLAGINGAVVTGAGLKVQFLKVRNKSTNTHAMTFSKGAANGWDGAGAAFSLTLPPGGEGLLYLPEAGSNISAGTGSDGVRNIGIAGTGTDVAELAIVMG